MVQNLLYASARFLNRKGEFGGGGRKKKGKKNRRRTPGSTLNSPLWRTMLWSGGGSEKRKGERRHQALHFLILLPGEKARGKGWGGGRWGWNIKLSTSAQWRESMSKGVYDGEGAPKGGWGSE